jgi:general secretion pathway protein D
MLKRRFLLVAGVLVLGLLAPAPSQVARAEDMSITFAEGIEIEDLLKTLGTHTGKSIVWQEKDKNLAGKKITGATNFTAPGDRVFEVVRALLTFYELVMVPIGPKDYQIYLVMNAREQMSIVRLKPVYVELNEGNLAEYETQDGLFIATTIKIKNMDNLRDARQALSRIVTQNNIGQVTEVPAARSFVVTDFAPTAVAIYRLLREMDVQPQGKKVKQAYYPLDNALAEDIEPILVDLFTGRTRVSQPVPGQPGGGDVQDPEPRILSDPRTNQIIVYAIEDDLIEIEALIKHLDKELMLVRQFVHVLRLRNLKAEDTATVLTTLIEGTTLFGTSAGGFGSSRTSSGRRTTGGASRTTTTGRVGGAAPPAGNVQLPPEQQEKPTVVADVASNSLIIAAGPGQFEQIERVVKEIDVRKSQVLIEAALVELSLDDAYKFVTEIAGLDKGGLNKGGGTTAFGGTGFGLTEYFDRDGDGLLTDRLPPFIGAGGAPFQGFVGGLFAEGQVPLIFNALDTVKKTRILQLPSIVTSDNEEATIVVNDEQATTANTVTSGGNTSAGFGNFEPAGTTLSISPHIALDTYLLLNINLEVSGFKGNPRVVNGAQIPADKFTRKLITAVTVPDRHTVILGGLIGETQRDTVDKVPFLGDIPILGELFKGTSKQCVKTNLFLFVTPTILRNTDEQFADFDRVTCDRKRKADELIGAVDIPFSNFVGCRDRCIDPATGTVRGSGSTSERLDRLGVLEATRFGRVDKERLAAEARARQAAIESGNGAGARGK